MNFLSHYYFDQSSDSYTVLGTLLPDLTANAQKEWKLYPQKNPQVFEHDVELKAILRGWNRHLAVDKYFHNSIFFTTHSQQLSAKLRPILQNSPVKAYFLAHISLELLLDGLLLKNNKVSTEAFYSHLAAYDVEKIVQFLELNLVEDTRPFTLYFERFCSSAYLNSYRETEKIAYALHRICLRVWPESLTEVEQEEITEILVAYQRELESVYFEIFTEISSALALETKQ
jgi:acyl carrier protein phosphodiesterase